MCRPGERVHDMTVNAFAGKIYFNRRLRRDAAALVVLASSFVFGLPNSQLKAQATTGDTPSANSLTSQEWEKAAGGKMEFDVASIRPAEPCVSRCTNIGLSIDDAPIPPGGDFKAD